MPADDLRQIEVFAELSDEVLKHLQGALEQQEYTDGQRVFEEGDQGNAVFFIRTGHARVEKRITAGGAETKTLSVIAPGEFFGEMSLFDGQPRSASTVAVGTLRVYRVTRGVFDRLLESDRATAAALLFSVIKTLNRRIRSLSSKVVVFHEIGKTIGEADSLKQLAEVVLEQLREATGATSIVLAIQLEFFDRLEIVRSIGRTLAPEAIEAISRREGLLGRVLKERRGLLIEDFDATPPSEPKAGYESRSLMIEPIVVKDKVLGVLLLGHDSARRFSLNELSLCASVAGLVAQALLNFRHREEEQARSKLGRQYVRF